MWRGGTTALAATSQCLLISFSDNTFMRGRFGLECLLPGDACASGSWGATRRGRVCQARGRPECRQGCRRYRLAKAHRGTQECWHDPSKLRAKSQRYGEENGRGETQEPIGRSAIPGHPRGRPQLRRCGSRHRPQDRALHRREETREPARMPALPAKSARTGSVSVGRAIEVKGEKP